MRLFFVRSISHSKPIKQKESIPPLPDLIRARACAWRPLIAAGKQRRLFTGFLFFLLLAHRRLHRPVSALKLPASMAGKRRKKPPSPRPKKKKKKMASIIPVLRIPAGVAGLINIQRLIHRAGDNDRVTHVDFSCLFWMDISEAAAAAAAAAAAKKNPKR